MNRAVIAAALALTLAPPSLAAQASAPGTSGPAAPQPAPPTGGQAPAAQSATKPSPNAQRVARALTTQPSWNETVDAYASSLASQISAAVKSQGGDAPADVEKRVRAGLDEAVGYDEVVRLQAQALAGRFSEDELRTIATFYESGPGKKLVSELPAVSRQVIEVVQQRMSAAIPHIVQDVAPALARAKPDAAEGTAPSGTGRETPQVQARKPPAQSAPPRR